MPLDAEVVVVGGGPAGVVSAIGLARLGRDVLLCEAQAFPRDHIGICLSAGVSQQLAFLNIRHVLDRSEHYQISRVARRWSSEQDEILADPGSFIVNRGLFDADLIEAARKSGVRILQPARVGSTARSDAGWRLEVRSPLGVQAIHTAFLIEAGGRQSRIRKRLQSGPPTLALYGRWRGPPAPDIRISAEANGWIWAAPASMNETVVVAFVAPGDLRREQGTLDARYRQMVRDSGIIDGNQEFSEELKVCNATPYAAVGEVEGMLRIGDADVALDPLSSSGVQAAIQSALAATPIINTLLTPSMDGEPALEFWRGRRQDRIEQHRRWAGEIYADALRRHPTKFWRRRCGPPSKSTIQDGKSPLPHPDQLIKLCGAARLELAPCLTDRFVERIECITHARLTEPVAFVDGVYLPPLLRQLGVPRRARDILESWCLTLPPHKAYALLAWAWRREIVTGVERNPANSRH